MIVCAMLLQRFGAPAHTDSGLWDVQAEPVMWPIDLSPIVLAVLFYVAARRQMQVAAAGERSAAERRRYEAMFGALAEGVFITAGTTARNS